MVRRPLRFALVLISSLACLAFGQKPDPLFAKFRAYREVITEPIYGLAKVKSLIKRIKEDEEMNRRLKDRDYNRLTLEEKFTYAMLHGEDFSQNCSETSPLEDERNRIFSYPPDAFGNEAAWSDRQTKFLAKNRPLVIKLLRATIKSHKRVGLNIKNAITQVNGVELVPDLIAANRRDSRDNDILSVLLLLMKENKYKPFLATPLYKKFYGENSNYGVFEPATPATRKLILNLAGAFVRKR